MVLRIFILLLVLLSVVATRESAAAACDNCAEWNKPHQPFRIYGNTYFVGVDGLSVILITSDRGHVLIDGALPESAPQIAANIAKLGFRIEDVKLIANSHAHFDHSGGIAELQRLSNATVVASVSGARVIEAGRSGSDDPQINSVMPFPPAKKVRSVRHEEVLRVGPIAITAHYTPGHTPGATSWTWRSCEKQRCLNVAYADSLTAVSDDDFRFSDSPNYPGAARDFENTFAVVAALPCDILLTPHPAASDMWGRLARRDKEGTPDAFIASNACRQYADNARLRFQKRIAGERASLEKSPR